MPPAASKRRLTPGSRLLRVPEFRALAVAGLLSATGDQLARVALSVLVYARTSSPLLTGLTYALTFLPAVIGGPLLSGLADRRPRRQVMVATDITRALLVAAMAVRGLSLPALLSLLVVVNVLEAPFDAARAALMPDVSGDLYLAALVVDRTVQQTAQVLGFAGSGVLLLVFSPNTALLADAASFLVSAVLLQRRVTHRPAAATATQSVRGRWLPRANQALGDARLGMSTIWSDRRVRRAVLLTWLASAFAIVPEGLAAPYARQLGGGSTLVALLLAANPVGNVLSGLPAARWSQRSPDRLLAPLAYLVVLPLALCAPDPPAPVVLGLVAVSGTGMTVSLLARTIFVAHVPEHVRGRAFGVAGTGIIVGQGLAVAFAGGAASLLAPSTVVGWSGLIGATATLLLLTATRPR
ncbi:MAG: MFS transporter [Actinomycetota bacterium]|nr:MFS transporter [Actinomycetota bacterium]